MACLLMQLFLILADAGQDHVRMAQARGGATPSASPGVQGSSQRPQGGGGGGSAPGPGPGPGPSKAGGQYNAFGDVGQQLRTSMMMSNSVSGGSGSGAQMSSSGTSVQSVGNGRPSFSSGPASSLPMTDRPSCGTHWSSSSSSFKILSRTTTVGSEMNSHQR